MAVSEIFAYQAQLVQDKINFFLCSLQKEMHDFGVDTIRLIAEQLVSVLFSNIFCKETFGKLFKSLLELA